MQLQVAMRGSQGLHMLSGSPRFEEGAESRSGFDRDPSANCKAMAFSAEGSRFAWSDGREVKIATFGDGSWTVGGRGLESTGRTAFLRFSPRGSVLCTWEAFAKSSAEEKNNVRLWDAATGRLLHGYVHRKADGWFPQWTGDEGLASHRSPNGEVVFYAENRFDEGPLPQRVSLKGLESFSVSPGAPPLVACYIAGAASGPGFFKLFAYPNFADAVASKSFMTADKVDVKWCPSDGGRSCLVLAQSDVDKTGASYYGRTQLHLADGTDGSTSLVRLPKQGPIYCTEWKPTRPPSFVVVYGYMPAAATLFNAKCEPVLDMGFGPRNMAAFNPQGNLVLVGGFGNLRGNVEVWDVDKGRKRVSQFAAEDATDLKWCPDGQHVLTSTCAPRLRTGNGFKVWHYTSTLMHETVLVDTKKERKEQLPDAIAAPTCDELWEAAWRPVPAGTFSEVFEPLDEPIGGGVALKAPQASKQAYRPPAARGQPPSTFDLHAADLQPLVGKRSSSRIPVGMVVEDKGKQQKKKGKKKGGGGEAAAAPPPSRKEEPSTSQNGSDAERLKQVWKLERKIADIGKLKARLADGDVLEVNQLEKVGKEAELLEQLAKLQV